jgi:thioredoxin-dependent peroxiredoxin
MKKTIAGLGLVLASAAAAMALVVGQPAPSFEAQSTGGPVKLSDYSGKWLVLYFYPKAGTTICTKEACSFRDGMAELGKLKAAVLGCSFDTLDAQKKFKAEQKLPFDLISDTNRVVTKAYGAVGRLPFLPDRKTFIIGPDGRLEREFDKVADASAHAAEIAAALRDLQQAKK